VKYVLFAIRIANFSCFDFITQPNGAGKSIVSRFLVKFAILIAKVFTIVLYTYVAVNISSS